MPVTPRDEKANRVTHLHNVFNTQSTFITPAELNVCCLLNLIHSKSRWD